jgi:hypothetical protein
MISGCLPDQAALHGVLKQINNLGLTLISVNAVNERNCERKDHGYPGHNKS